jgi:exopolysaccharide biosynthesis polyprenyl glycosylphosphotransferase
MRDDSIPPSPAADAARTDRRLSGDETPYDRRDPDLRLPVPLSEGPGRWRTMRRDRIQRRLLLCADVCAAALAVTGARLLGDHHDAPASAAPLLIVPIAILAAKLLGLYDRDELVLRTSTLDEAPALFQLATLSALLTQVADEVLGVGPLNGDQVLGLWVLLFIGALLARTAARKVGHLVSPAERCLVVGDTRGMGAVGSRLKEGTGINAQLVGRLALTPDQDHDQAMHELERAIAASDVDRVILAPRTLDSDAILDVVRLVKALGVKVSLLPRLLEVVGSSVVFDEFNGITMLGVRRFGLSRSSSAIKRATDVLGASVGLVLLGPFMLLAAAAIKLDSRGPVLYRQKRVGRDGRAFEIMKFRTMVDNAHALRASLRDETATPDGELFKISDDPRVTRVGRLLRRMSLDELPQLLNVLRGDMSLVGPRPLVVDEDALVHGWHRRRLHLTPGMTGPWQVLGSAERVPLAEMVNIDYLYIANWSLFTDVKIMLRTVLHMLRRHGV